MRLTLAAAAISFAFSVPGIAYASGSASVTQNGVDNYGTIEQADTTAVSATIIQQGDRNQAGLPADGESAALQGILQANEQFSNATINQRGNDNSGRIEQTDGANNSASVFQGGNVPSNGNSGVVLQLGSTNSFGQVFQDRATGNNAGVQQSGDSNSAILVQGNFRWTGTQFALVNLPAADSFANLLQSGHNQSAVFDQLGNNQRATGNQSGAWNDANIMQEGELNTANINQHGTGLTAGDRNTATINQNGGGFFANVSQSGMRNTALITQH